MEDSKDNTKIPLPLYPLPPIPERIIRVLTKQTKIPIRRIPLCTLNGQWPSVAGPSKNKPHLVSSTPLNLDEKKMIGDQCLDREFEFFDGQEPTGSVDSGPVDTDESEENVNEESPAGQAIETYVTVRKSVESSPVDTDQSDLFNKAVCEENVNEESPAEQVNATYVAVPDRDLEDLDDEESTESVKTPANKKKLAEPARVKKLISLKTSHSEELQGTKRSEDNERLSSLQYQRLSENLNPPDAITIQLSERLQTYFERDRLDYLLKSEKKASPTQFIHKSTRACIVNWLMNVNGPDGNPAVLQTACWFFDAVLAQRAIPPEQLQLKGSACFWTAQKWYPQTAVTATELAKHTYNGFLEAQLLDAEKEILMLLGYPRQPVVPQDFISFFAWKCDKENHGLIEMAATFFAMCGLLFHTTFCSEFPSVVAAAAVKNACICLERSDLEAKLESCPWYKKAEAKAISFKRTCSAQRSAVRSGALPSFEFNAPYHHYGRPPLNLAQRMVEASAKLSTLDASILPSTMLHLL